MKLTEEEKTEFFKVFSQGAFCSSDMLDIISKWDENLPERKKIAEAIILLNLAMQDIGQEFMSLLKKSKQEDALVLEIEELTKPTVIK